jgi:hypothetical protein
LLQLEAAANDYFLVYGPKGAMRFEELMRMSDEFIINKGSFNPLHHGHIAMMEEGKEIVPGGVPVFLISTYRYDKPHISWDELESRISSIIHQGYYVIVCKEPFFYKTFAMLRRMTDKNKKFYFTIGSDTLNRIYKTDLENTVDKDHPEPSPYMARVTVEGMKRIYADRFKFIVLMREGDTLVPETAWYDAFLINTPDYKDDGISSTKIRNGEIQNKI